MKKLTVTYKAPPGDSKVLEAFGMTFFDGKSEEVTVDDDVAEKLQGNKSFQCSKPTDAEVAKPDPAKEKAQADAAKAADDAKRTAQGAPPPVRGQVNPNLPAEGDDKEADKSAEKETKNENKAHGLPHR
jgi:hypothetical protein